MQEIKSYTDLEQSKKLAEILPLESADMCYLQENGQAKTISPLKLSEILNVSKPQVIPCWSLVSLLGILPNGIVMNKDSQNGKYHCSSKYIGTYVTADNPVDACVAMVEKLHELNLL